MHETLDFRLELDNMCVPLTCTARACNRLHVSGFCELVLDRASVRVADAG